MNAHYNEHRNRIKYHPDSNTTSRRRDMPDHIKVAGTEFPNPSSNSTPFNATNRSHHLLEVNQDTLDEHMRSQSRFNEQIYFRLHALEAVMDKMLDCIQDVHQRSRALEKAYRDLQQRIQSAARPATDEEGQPSDAPSAAQSTDGLDQKLVRSFVLPIDGVLQEVLKDAGEHKHKEPPVRSVYTDVPEQRHVNDEIFAELEAFAKLFKESRVPKLIFPDGSVQQVRQDRDS
ncbi:hypothetical protein CLAFUW4_07055 [Fulvia fulva]|uniref:Uncharacterized protein n=1 Tax=Passalora fulva TaxID=5499 RepID=A0A9Q8P9P0_PASFU|nr:uncharacterized protein CLAFUR5_07192 [Fulvia fulva]KAK4622209.1 hypothetical protein CLAFUR4_07064 [Fulvia fulva]KAK4622735.1 hypothetical protein CLAFUR0_07062 [Fulvia fulva]UJO18464.1 hypothetical protein CLAFUR5_07192 [Fulvia fulva]WPV16729.1 hypothetical protein CLAFUW4_07055 [Fulvia fulva]WPV31382.1 hypothetical protein CLAFUW7_07055 [Fulvia fulva]